MSSERRSLAALIAGQIAIVLAVFGLLEWHARRTLARLPPPIVESGVAHPPYFNNPGVETSPRTFGFHFKYRINKFGLRGPETTLAKPEHTRRVLILGDSVIFGAMVKGEDTISLQLERMLNEPPGSGKWEVLNGGVGGYDSWDYEGFLKLKGLAFKPDIVIVGLYMNDHISRDVYNETTRIKSSPNRRLLAGIRDVFLHSEFFSTCLHFMQRHQTPKHPLISFRKPLKPADEEAIEGFFPGDPQSAQAIKKFLREYNYDPFFVKDTLPWLLDVPRWENISGPLAGIRNICRANGIRLLGTVLPIQFEVYPGYRWPQPHKRIGEIYASLGIPFVDMQPVLAKTGHGDEFYQMRYDYAHPDRAAYDLEARELLAKLSELKWLEK